MEQATVTTLPISPGSFWTIVILVIVLVCACLLVALWKSDAPPKDGWRAFVEALGIARFPNYLTMPSVAVWGALFLALLIGIPGVIHGIFFGESAADPVERRWLLLSLTALAAAMGAVVALPFTLIKTRQNERQTRATEEGLITDRINNAVEGLGAEKKVDRIGRPVTFKDAEDKEETVIQWQGETLPEGDVLEKGDWQVFSETLPNLEVRIGAILALERLARNNLDIHVQIMEILCAYIRENAPASGAKPIPEFVEPEEKPSKDRSLRSIWQEAIESYNTELQEILRNIHPREDIQVALTVLGRRSAEGRLREARHNNPDPKTKFIFDGPGPEALKRNENGSIDQKELNDWKKARSAYRGYRLDLRGTNLQGADMAKLNFGGARFENAQLQGADLEGARLQGAVLGVAQLQGADLEGARLQGAYLGVAQLQGAYLEGARLQGAYLRGAQLQGADLEGARLQGADLEGARLQGAYLRGAQLQGADLEGARLQGADLGVAQLQGTHLGGAQLQGAYLRGAQLQGAHLGGAQLQGAHLRGAQLQGAYLRGAQLQGANLGWARLQGADLGWARFDADTDLTGANLTRTAVKSVDFTDVPQIKGHVGGLFGDASTKLPSGVNAPPHWPGVELDWSEFDEEWKKWQAGPDTYVPPDPPKPQ